VLTDDAIDHVIRAHKSGEENEGFAKWATDEEIAVHNYNLSVRRYVSPWSDGDGEVLDLNQAIEAYRDARANRAASETRLDEVIKNLEEV
jgi:type I restriction-modification system DNA methylase subunit